MKEALLLNFLGTIQGDFYLFLNHTGLDLKNHGILAKTFLKINMFPGLSYMLALWRIGSASDSRSEGWVFEALQGQLTFIFFKAINIMLY